MLAGRKIRTVYLLINPILCNHQLHGAGHSVIMYMRLEYLCERTGAVGKRDRCLAQDVLLMNTGV